MKYAASLASVLLISSLLAACASPPEEIPTAYVPAKEYAALNCPQIETELETNAEETSELLFVLKDKANVDAAQMGIGMVFFPTLLFLEGGDGEEAKQYSRLKGERRALVRQAVKKECSFDLSETDMTAANEPCPKGEKCPPALVRRVPLLQ